MRIVFQKVIVFFLTFLGYAGLHTLRQGWSFSKTQLEDELQVEETMLGLIDTLYLLSYTAGMAVLGSFIGRFSLKWYVIIGMLLSALSYVSFALLYLMSGVFSVPFMAAMMCLNGFFQATGWPGLMGIIGNWFSKDKKGLLMAIWAMNANAGNILASTFCNLLKQNGISWTYNFLLTAFFTAIVGVLMIFLLKAKPEYQEQQLLQNQIVPEQAQDQNRQSIITQNNQPHEGEATSNEKPEEEKKSLKPHNIFKALLLPRVPLYVIGYACLKGCIYGILFWLPTFLEHKNLGNEKGYISDMIDLGALVGGAIVGILVDYFDKRSIFLSPLLFVCSIVMFVISFAGSDAAWVYYLGMLLIGILLGGPYNIIGTVIAINIGQQSGTANNVTSVSSLIEGTAALFAAISQFANSYLGESIFYLFAVECIVAAAVLVPLLITEIKAIRGKTKTKQVNDLQ